MYKFQLLSLFIILCGSSFSQPKVYTTSNAHSHNDYEKAYPFSAAYKQQFGSIEADVFLLNDQLYVAHTKEELANAKTLEALYLKPLSDIITQNKNFAYADKKKQLQLMIDIKTDSLSTLNKLIAQLQQYPALLSSPTLKIVISGNRPAPAAISNFPNYIHFDAQFTIDYPEAALKKIEMYSDNFKKYSQWNGQGNISALDSIAISVAVKKAHALYKKVRFWNAPDTPEAWNFFMNVGADYINTDRIEEISSYLKRNSKRFSKK